MRISTVAVIGAGTMGAGIAQVCAQTGWQTRLYDAFPEGLQKGMDSISAFWEGDCSRQDYRAAEIRMVSEFEFTWGYVCGCIWS